MHAMHTLAVENTFDLLCSALLFQTLECLEVVECSPETLVAHMQLRGKYNA